MITAPPSSTANSLPKLLHLHLAIMANPTPNFDNIANATADLVTSATILNTELPRTRNLQGIKGTQAILNSFAEIRTRLSRMENNQHRMQNSQKIAGNSRATLLALQNPVTGLEIPNCPRTLAQINRLPSAEAARILQELQLPVPAGASNRRDAVRDQFLL